MFGLSVFENFIDLDEKNDLLDHPQGDFLGMHAIVLVGYNDVTQTVEILNSRGETIGNRGFFRISYKYLLNNDLCFDFFVVNS